ncbi:MAG: D-alanyl-D-alanine carboxypeptidase [Parvibaculum sp.]|uniref:D-alanyl-D-alanine carboxypeptidase n=1 Tax=Parvibaculum sp. TaxID=2024848 RepID=UPI00284EABE2|nr:D-alanyl-D-alanine carboxypeptidase [Parvibaculum sp.]MDR3499146.1 D-alanyl-D-alanine carboxypeptidase [Parvibaculum sp.]
MACTVLLALGLTMTNADARAKHHHNRASAGPAFTPKAAALVMDVNTGRILYSNNADAQCYPASLTKVMTLYLLFEQLRDGKVTLKTRMPVSHHATAQAPSRLGLKAGQTITVEDAILALVTKSANDAAVTVGEYIGGTEKQFAVLMTAKARALGMKHTQYMNASGLPNKNQLITARDMATLAKRIQVDFPQYYHYFSTEEFAWDGKLIRNHNHLLGKYQGVNGLKTGYTAASGFNLTTSVWRDNKSVIGVVLGGKTARARDLEMVSILDRTMPSAVAMRDTGTRFASAAPAPRAFDKPAGISNDDRNALAALASTDESDPDEESYTGTDQVASMSATPPTVKMAPVADDHERPAAPAAVKPVAVAAAPTALPKPVVVAAAIPAPAPAPTKPVAAAPVRVASAEPAAANTLGVLPAPRPAEPIAAAAASTNGPMVPGRRAAAPLDHATAYALAALAQAEGPVRRVGRDLGSLIVTPAQASEGPQSASAVGLRTAVNEGKLSTPQHGWQAGDPLIPEGSWVIQIGAYADQADAVDRIRIAIKAAPTELGKAVPVTLPFKTADNRTLYRSRFGGFDDEKEARNACGRLARESISCIAIPPANWSMPASAGAKEKAPS